MAKMETRFIKNIQFTKLIKIDGKLKELIRKSNSYPEGQFTIDVIDDRGNRIIFNMENSKPLEDYSYGTTSLGGKFKNLCWKK